MEALKDEDRKRRLRQIEERIQDPRSIANVDCLLHPTTSSHKENTHIKLQPRQLHLIAVNPPEETPASSTSNKEPA
uniref:Uncharacterized protein n=1 Tax=Timema monikensis TaxID=170555 RepID=A0A7R9HST0_9NEOP|nr:unnamed protein product [Timema monikensis]